MSSSACGVNSPSPRAVQVTRAGPHFVKDQLVQADQSSFFPELWLQ